MTQFHNSRPVSRLQGVLLAASFLLAVASASAAQLNLATKPLFAGAAVPPMVMIDLSKDHSLHQKAYNDYSDLDNKDGLETTYTNAIVYAGYFDSFKCYSYSTANNYYVPAGTTTDKLCADTKDAKGNTVANALWSGNFLNWATMSRIDEVRKILYGGTRSIDTTTTTVLERAFLPTDAHAWAKYYNGSDIKNLVPASMVDDNGTPTSSGDTLELKSAILDVNVNSSGNMVLGDQIRLVPTNGPAGTSMTGWITKINGNKITLAIYPESVFKGANANSTYKQWAVTNLTRGGLTLCNVTPKDDNNDLSQANTSAPQIRAAKGNYATWAASEKRQCNWREEANSTQFDFLPRIGNTQVGSSSNGNRAAVSGINSSAENPAYKERGAGSGVSTGTFNARVQVCVPNLINTENCRPYGTGGTIFKPYGLLQKYGETGDMLFGLMTGSYDKNISGGVLRQNVTNFSTEVDPDTGVFMYRDANSPVKGIVWNIDRLRPYGYSYGDGGYTSNSADACNYQQTGIVSDGSGENAQGSPAKEGNCSTWGNPISEIFVETLRYFAGKQADSRFQPASGGKDSKLQLTTPAWDNPMNPGTKATTKAPYCTPLNALVFNSSVSSYDNDQLDQFSQISSAKSISTLTDEVGGTEGINGGSWFAGQVSGKADASSENLCSAKKIDLFSTALGICPEGPSQKGTFQIAGAAFFAHMNRIRADIPVPDTSDTKSMKVSTYAVQLATTTPKIDVNVNGKKVTILPAYMLAPGNSTTKRSPGTLVDFKVISQTPTSGRFYVNWEDSIAGGDYDQDVWGILSYSINGDKITISTRVVSASTSNAQGFGYSISGTGVTDGPHFHSGIFDFTLDGCNKCNLGDPETSVTYTATGTAGSQFQDPLLYAAKWGGFKDLSKDDGSKGTGLADDPKKWDVLQADGTSGPDGLPDNYFYATNPAALAAALERAFLSILKTSSAAAIANSSPDLNPDTRIYQARFNGTDWSGQLLAYNLDDVGNKVQPEVWDAGQKMKAKAATDRVILTYNATTAAGTGIPFRWDKLPTAYQTLLNIKNDGADRLLWLRGDPVKEGDGTDKYRRRPSTPLGDIVNSSPQYVGPPQSGYGELDYLTFTQKYAKRKPMLYVGANDGMLHAFSAEPGADDDGTELFAYVPTMMFPKLGSLPSQDYTHAYFVDGTPVVADARVNGAWKTVLVGSLGGGGKGMYALDVTDPTAVTEATAANTILWEFPGSADEDLGFTYGRPRIMKMANGKWAALFGNGYNSKNGRGSIFIAYLDRPANSKTWTINTDYIKLTLDDAGLTTPNGIGEVIPADVNGDGTTDYIYAGDLQGKLWKFDVRSKTDSDWQNKRRVLFNATDANGKAQPITTGGDVLLNPAGGAIVNFATGRYLDVSDPTDLSRQTVYGIWDQFSDTQPTVSRADLQVQDILERGVIFGKDYTTTTDTNIIYTPTGKIKGWYLDLLTPNGAEEGERASGAVQLRDARLVLPTMTPSSEVCASGGQSRLFEINAITGGRLTTPPTDLNGDGKIDSKDTVNGVIVSAVGLGVGVGTTPTVIKCGAGKECKYVSGSNGGSEMILESAGSPVGRISWREILH